MPDVCQQFHQWMRRMDQSAITCTLLIVFCLTCVQLIYSVFCALLPPYLLSLPPHMVCLVADYLSVCPLVFGQGIVKERFERLATTTLPPLASTSIHATATVLVVEKMISHMTTVTYASTALKNVLHIAHVRVSPPPLYLFQKNLNACRGCGCSIWVHGQTCRTSNFPHMYDAKDDTHPEDDAWHVAFASHSKQSKVGVKCIASVIFVQAEVFFHIRTILYLCVVVSLPYCLLVWESFNYYLP